MLGLQPSIASHTKGAANNHSILSCVRNMWYDEFINHFDDYLRLLNDNKTIPVVVTPFSGLQKITWFNAFYFNNLLANDFDLPFYDNRYKYEILFSLTNYKVIGRIMNNVDNEFLPNIKINFLITSKQEMFNYINKFQNYEHI